MEKPLQHLAMISAAFCLIVVLGAAPASAPATSSAADSEGWQGRLFTPTFLDKIGDTYFLVDCWHHRVLWSRKLDGDIARWQTLDDSLAGPHSIASDGEIFVVDDTGRDGLRVYRREGDAFQRIQEVHGLPERPHRVRYDPPTKAFYVIAANSQDIYKLVRREDGLKQVYKRHLGFLGSAYTRSITIADGAIYIISDPGFIYKTEYRDDSFKVLAKYRVPEGMASMNDLFPTGDGWWYLTASYLKIARVRSLDDLNAGRFQDVHAQIGMHGTPYYLSKIDGRYYVPVIAQNNGILSFVHDGDRISDVQVLCNFRGENKADVKRYKELPK